MPGALQSSGHFAVYVLGSRRLCTHMFKGTRADREPGLLREGNYDRIFLMEAAKSTMTNRNPYRFFIPYQGHERTS